jgi:hypothetical protein
MSHGNKSMSILFSEDYYCLAKKAVSAFPKAGDEGAKK